MKLIFAAIPIGRKFVKVYYNSAYQEYVVRLYQRTKRGEVIHYDAADSFHSDREDAISTAIYVMNEEHKATLGVNDND